MKGSRLTRTIATGGAVIALAMGAATSPASAAPVEKGHFHDVSSEVIEGFCGDLTVREDGDVAGSFLVTPHGPDGLIYGAESVHGSVAWTNLANNLTLTQAFSGRSKDLKVTDNGDGTLTIIGLITGGTRIIGPDGKLLFADPGQVRFELLIDHAGTPTDPSDDEVIADLGVVKGSTGRNDLEGRDFCEDIHEFIG